MNDDDIFKHDPEFDRRPTFELLEHVDDPRLFVRARTLAALARRSKENEEIVQIVLDAIRERENKLVLMFGLSTTMLVFACFWEFGPDAVKPALADILNAMGDRERCKTLWFLKSQGIAVDGLEAMV